MGFGHRFMSYNLALELLLVCLVIILLLAIIFSFISKSRRLSSPDYIENLAILNKRYASGETTRNEYDEIKSILEGEK
jgi:uncharacterized membrane protein